MQILGCFNQYLQKHPHLFYRWGLKSSYYPERIPRPSRMMKNVKVSFSKLSFIFQKRPYLLIDINKMVTPMVC